jgi:hypothetical protein
VKTKIKKNETLRHESWGPGVKFLPKLLHGYVDALVWFVAIK